MFLSQKQLFQQSFFSHLWLLQLSAVKTFKKKLQAIQNYKFYLGNLFL